MTEPGTQDTTNTLLFALRTNMLCHMRTSESRTGIPLDTRIQVNTSMLKLCNAEIQAGSVAGARIDTWLCVHRNQANENTFINSEKENDT